MHTSFTMLKNKAGHSLLVLLLAVLLLSCNRDGENTNTEVAINKDLNVPALLERKTQSGPKGEQVLIRQTYDAAIAALKNNPQDTKQYLTLATIFITECRVTGNAAYYNTAAVRMLDKVITDSKQDQNMKFEAYGLKSAVLLNVHQFKDALTVAEEGRKINDFNAGIYGALVDANVELGHYTEAVKDCDKMLSIRPDLRSYSRASYLRQIHGDNAGAIAAMKMAVEAGVPGMESTEWARVTLGDLYLNTGKADTAALIYEAALAYRPGYPFAEMGLARVERARKNYDASVLHTRNAIKILSEGAFVTFLGEVYQLKGDKEKAAATAGDVVRLLEEGEKEQAKNNVLKHNGNRELAIAYINNKELDKALAAALKDYNMRPDNIDANDLVAWIYYLKGDYKNAKTHADKLFVTHIKNAAVLYKAGIIYTAAGEEAKGAQYKKDALAISPYIDQSIMDAVKS
jgi:tetratricopeptide (TPR) repeat protein